MKEHRHIGPLFSAEEEACLTHAQMQGYAAGDITDAEKHHVERHLLNCDLCALAYEGLAEEDAAVVAAGAEAIAAEAWSRVAEREKKRRSGAILWMSSAAVILILILVGFFVIDQQQDNKLDELADSMFELPDAPEARGGDESVASADMPSEGVDGSFEAPGMRERTEDNGSGFDGSMDRNMGGNGPVTPVPDMDPPPPAEEAAKDAIELDDVEVMDEIAEFDFAMEEVEEEPVDMVAPVEVMEPELVTSMDSRNQNEDPAQKPQFQEKFLAGTSTGTVSGNTATISAEQQIAVTGVGTMTDSTSLTGGGMLADIGGDDDWDEDLSQVVEKEEEKSDVESIDNAIVYTSPTRSTTSDQDEIFYNNGTENKSLELNDISVSSSVRDLKKTETRGRRDKGASKGKKYAATKNSRSAAKESNEELSNRTDYYRRGLEAYEGRDFQKGARYLRQASSDAPNNLQAHFYAALCFMEIDQHTAALFHLDRILAQPQNSLTEEAKWYKSIALMRLGKRKEAKSMLEEIRIEGGKRKSDANKVLDEF